MLINNIDIGDRLINGQIGLVKYIKSVAGKITKIHISFDDNLAGSRTLSHDIDGFQLNESKFHSVLEKHPSPLSRHSFH